MLREMQLIVGLWKVLESCARDSERVDSTRES